MSFLGFYPFSNWERESGKQNFGVKEKCPKVTYLILLTGFHWRIFLLSRANRLCTVFNTGLKDFGVLRVSVSLLSLARSKMAIVRLPRDLPKNYLFLYLLPLRGREPHFRLGSPPIIWLRFLFPLPMSGDPRSLRCEHLRDPHSFLTVTFWLLDNFSSTWGEYHSYLFVFVSYHVTVGKLILNVKCVLKSMIDTVDIRKWLSYFSCSFRFPFVNQVLYVIHCVRYLCNINLLISKTEIRVNH